MIEKVRAVINRLFRQLSRRSIGLIVLLSVLQLAVSFVLYVGYWGDSYYAWYREALVATFFLLAAGVLFLYGLYRARIELLHGVGSAMSAELYVLQSALNRYEALQIMASTLSATLSFELVIDEALDVCRLALADLGLRSDALVGAVFLFDGQDLVPLQPLLTDEGKVLMGEEGVVAEALRQGEPAITDNPYDDPELAQFEAFNKCLTLVSVPLRVGYRLYGVMILGVNKAVKFEDVHLKLFSAVADQTVIALQNAQLYQELEAESQRLIEADANARRELARDLHDGPVQQVAAIAMRLNALRRIAAQEPNRIPEELEKLEKLAKNSSQELRGMLFTLRPLLLETKGLGPAIESMLVQIREGQGIITSMEGSDYGQLLNEQAQEVVYSIIEEALSNARKHANAHTIEVRFWRKDDLFVARVFDDGVGFDRFKTNQDYAARGSLGLINMRERAERIGAALQVDSAPGLGAKITLAVPLSRNGRVQAAETDPIAAR
ncbi:MAG: GAF domain-containing sensor histidine kinase [Candidatus Promineifilaceae bacterium]